MNLSPSLNLLLSQADESLAKVLQKALRGQRLNVNDGLLLYQSKDLGLLGSVASEIKHRKSGDEVYFNKNFHIEPTNICIYHCLFCSYACHTGDSDSWESSIEEVVDQAKRYQKTDITEVHVVGGVHPDRDVYYYASMLQAIHQILPKVHIKAFSAVELEYMFQLANVTDKKGFEILKQSGLQSIPGGGAEIFDEFIRQQVCPEKTNSQRWLEIHQAAHEMGILSNATMLYGHIEHYEHRIDHLMQLRDLQDKTNGFNAFIPLKYRMANNPMSSIGEVTMMEDLKNYAVSRIFLDNIPHIKAYWPMIGKDATQLALSYGADDIDGTIDDTTKIYSMAGAEDQKPVMTVTEMIEMVRSAGYIPTERDSLYRVIRKY